MTEKEELPSGWAMATIAEVAAFISRGRAPRYTDESGVPVINQRCVRWNGINEQFLKFTDKTAVASLRREYILKAGDVLWNSTGTGTLGRAAIFNGLASEQSAVVDTHVTIVRPNGYEPRLLHYWIMSPAIQDQIEEMQTGSTNQVELPRKTIENTSIPVPPANEQRRIVERIDELFSQIEAGEAALARAKRLLARYRQAVLKAAVTGGLTKDWRERHPTAHGSHALQQMIEAREKAASATGKSTVKRHHIPEEHKFPVPDTWAWCSIEDAGDVQLGQQRAPQHHSGDHMRPYLRVANVFENKLDLSDVKTMNFMPSELAKFELRPGDILLNEGQSPDKLGRSAIYSGEIDGCCIQKTLLRFRAYSGLHPRFAQIVFRFYMNFERFKRIARITTNIGHLTRVRFVEMEFPVPPTEEQQLIADRFDALDTNIDSLIEAVPTSFSVALRQAILTAAFAGKLVPQDPADEPAAVLLDRIRAERTTTPATKPPRGRPPKPAAIAAQ